MGCTGKLRLFLIDAPPGPKVSYFKVSYFKDKVRLPAEVLGTAKPPFLWNLVLYPAKRGAVKQILTSSIECPNSTTKGTKEHEGTLYYSTLCANSRRSWFKIRKLHLRSFLDHLLLAGRKLPAFTRPITSARTQLLSAQLASPKCESPLSGGTLKGRMGDLTSST